MSVYSMIDKLRKRPGMYLGKNHITPLKHFLAGYSSAEYDYGFADSSSALLPLDFSFMHSFVNLVFGEMTNMGWCSQILENSDGDEEKALWKFFELYDMFRKIRMTKYYKAVLSPENIRYNDSMEHGCRHTGFNPEDREPIYLDPIAVYVAELDIPAYVLAVETKNYIELTNQFFESAKDAMGTGGFPSGAEHYFGKISGWTEHSAENIDFGKPVKF